MPSPLAELLGGLRDAFEPLGVRWYLFGAQAAILHGAARLSADVDVTVRLGEVFRAQGGKQRPGRLTRSIRGWSVPTLEPAADRGEKRSTD